MIISLVVEPILMMILMSVSTLFGWSDAMHYYYKYNGHAQRIFGFEHEVWTAIRALAFIPVWYKWFIHIGWIATLLGVGSVLMFPFFHDGMYYLKRNQYDGSYPLKWRAMTKSKTLSATPVLNEIHEDLSVTKRVINSVKKYIQETRISLNWATRLTLFLAGSSIYILIFFI